MVFGSFSVSQIRQRFVGGGVGDAGVGIDEVCGIDSCGKAGLADTSIDGGLAG